MEKNMVKESTLMPTRILIPVGGLSVKKMEKEFIHMLVLDKEYLQFYFSE